MWFSKVNTHLSDAMPSRTAPTAQPMKNKDVVNKVYISVPQYKSNWDKRKENPKLGNSRQNLLNETMTEKIKWKRLNWMGT